MEKCIFIGYPEGYKGWKFYNPTTKKTIISERADFDERYFPGLKNAPCLSPALPASFSVPTSPSPDLGTVEVLLDPPQGGGVCYASS